jgi:hypothetical protein
VRGAGISGESTGRLGLVRESNSDADDVLLRIRQDLSGILNVLEGRYLYLLKEGARGNVPEEGVIGELSFLSRDLRACFRRLIEMEERQDLSFTATKDLQEIDQRCVWLFRKIRVQQAFLKKLRLEATLRSLVSTEAFDIYQRVLTFDEEERESVAADEARIRALLQEENERPHPPPSSP